jgi:hypothetical protein
MPLYRWKNAPVGLEDAALEYPTNPDPERFVEATQASPKQTAAKPRNETPNADDGGTEENA